MPATVSMVMGSPSIVPVLPATSVTVTYVVTFYAQQLGFADTVAAYVSVTNALQKSLVDGSFVTALQAVATMYGVSNIAAAVITVQCQSNDPNRKVCRCQRYGEGYSTKGTRCPPRGRAR